MKTRALLAALALLFCSGARADFSFALLGDTPYGASEETSFTAMLREIDRENVAFVVHVGDFKDGWTSCGNAVFEQRLECLVDCLLNADINCTRCIIKNQDWWIH